VSVNLKNQLIVSKTLSGLRNNNMTQTLTSQTSEYQLDISKTQRNGSFLCPNCKAKISPDDHSEVSYSIYEIVATDDNLQELVLYCKRCRSFIHLRGFSSIPQTNDSTNCESIKNRKRVHCVAPHT